MVLNTFFNDRYIVIKASVFRYVMRIIDKFSFFSSSIYDRIIFYHSIFFF